MSVRRLMASVVPSPMRLPNPCAAPSSGRLASVATRSRADRAAPRARGGSRRGRRRRADIRAVIPDERLIVLGRVLVLWDRDCGFCAWTLALVLRADRRRVLVTRTIQEADADGLLDAIEPERRYASWHVVDADGQITSAGRAVTATLATPARGPAAGCRHARAADAHRARLPLGRRAPQRALTADPAALEGPRAAARRGPRPAADRLPRGGVGQRSW